MMAKLMSYPIPTCLFDKVNEVHVGATVVNLKLNIDDEIANDKYFEWKKWVFLHKGVFTYLLPMRGC